MMAGTLSKERVCYELKADMFLSQTNQSKQVCLKPIAAVAAEKSLYLILRLYLKHRNANGWVHKTLHPGEKLVCRTGEITHKPDQRISLLRT
jgi:hypothetical protein